MSIGMRKSTVACGFAAFEGFLARVQSLVSFQLSALRKGPRASRIVANVWLDTQVNPLVGIQTLVSRKNATTVFALDVRRRILSFDY